MRWPVISIHKPVEGLRYVEARAVDGYRVLVPIDESLAAGVQRAEATAVEHLGDHEASA